MIRLTIYLLIFSNFSHAQCSLEKKRVIQRISYYSHQWIKNNPPPALNYNSFRLFARSRKLDLACQSHVANDDYIEKMQKLVNLAFNNFYQKIHIYQINQLLMNISEKLKKLVQDLNKLD